MTTNGYIQFQREILARPWAKKDSEAVHVFLYLLCEAAYEPRPEIFAGKPITLQPGQLITGREKIAERTAVHASKVQRILKKLEEFGEIEQQTSNTSRLISINCDASRTTSEQRANNERTTNEQQMNNERTLYKEVNKERSKEGREAAPLHSSQFKVQSSNPTAPGTTEFALLRRIGKPAAQIWTQAGIDAQFTTPNNADLALQWMEYRTTKGKPYTSHQEIKALVEQFNKHTTADLLTMMNYSMTAGYTALYPDRLQKAHKATTQQRLNLDPTDLDKTRQNVHVTASGLKLVK